MGSLISEVSSRQVNAEKERLVQAKYIAETEKNLYVKVCMFWSNALTGRNFLSISAPGLFRSGKSDRGLFFPKKLLIIEHSNYVLRERILIV